MVLGPIFTKSNEMLSHPQGIALQLGETYTTANKSVGEWGEWPVVFEGLLGAP